MQNKDNLNPSQIPENPSAPKSGDDRNALHAQIALIIKHSKREMFRRSRSGMSLRDAANLFLLRLRNELGALLPQGKGGDDATN